MSILSEFIHRAIINEIWPFSKHALHAPVDTRILQYVMQHIPHVFAYRNLFYEWYILNGACEQKHWRALYQTLETQRDTLATAKILISSPRGIPHVTILALPTELRKYLKPEYRNAELLVELNHNSVHSASSDELMRAADGATNIEEFIEELSIELRALNDDETSSYIKRNTE